MKLINYTLTDEVRGVLARSSVTGTKLKLPEKLERKLYLDVNKALELMGGKWDRRSGAHVFADDAADVVADAVATGTVLDFAKTFQFYESPPAVVKRLCDLAELPAEWPLGFSILEPSAGRGAIVRELNARGYEPHVCELSPQNADRKYWADLRALPAAIDFFDLSAAHLYDRVVANPPFSRQQDVAHVSRMLEVCKPGGIVASVMSPGWRFRQTGAGSRFRREVLPQHEHSWHELPAGSFEESGTSVRAGILVVRVRP